MKEKIKELFEKSIDLGDENYTNEQIKNKWIGKKPATENEIKEAENRLGIKLPNDYVNFLRITNGFLTCSKSIEPSFEDINKIDFYKNFKFNAISQWKSNCFDNEILEVVSSLERAIMIAGFDEEQQFLIIPPKTPDQKWKYWKFAFWIPGEEEYDDLVDYFNTLVEFLDEEISK